VKIPHEREAADDDGQAVRVREIERDGERLLVADLGPLGDDAELDVVDGTAIVVSETRSVSGADEDEQGGPPADPRVVGRQIEIDLPEGVGPADVRLNNGVLTVEK
jgi:HSP20 family molecular chaperone IbpA